MEDQDLVVRERKSEAVLQSARRLFLQQGFGATSIAQIAADAGVSKATIYSNFADKDALLQALMEQQADAAARILQATLAPLQRPGPLGERLGEMAEALVRGVMRPEVVQLRRLAIAEAQRHPEIGRLYWERGPGATLSLLRAAFQDLAAAGELDLPDPAGAAERFAYALIGPLQDRALLHPEDAQSAGRIEDHVRSAVTALLVVADPRPIAPS